MRGEAGLPYKLTKNEVFITGGKLDKVGFFVGRVFDETPVQGGIHYVLLGETLSCLTLSTCVSLSPILPFAVALSLVLHVRYLKLKSKLVVQN